MAASDKELEEQLNETGNKLLNPPSSVEELLRHLDQVEECLAKVEQSPPDSMQNALSPLMKALVADKLFKHSDVDVKVAVAACISEITRITAPEAPYDDDQMREVFQLIISSFDNLVDKSSRSYTKRTSILETVAKVRSCVVMLDLECDALIIEMFQHFLKAIRDHHPENVFSSMETIMTLVLEESEEVPPELLSPILDHVKKDKEVHQVSRKLAEQVLKNCATKLKPYLTEAVKSSGLSLDNYSNLVASICQGTLGTLQQNDTIASEKEKQKATEVSSPEQADVHKDRPLKTEVSNGTAQIAENDSLADFKSTVKHEDCNVMDEPIKTDKLSGTDNGDSGAQKVADAGQEQKQTSKKKGKKPSSVKQVGSSKRSDVKETESGELPDSKVGVKDVTSSPCDPSANAAISSENEKETSDQALASKPLEDETMNATSPPQSANSPDESRSKKAVSQKKKESFTKEAKPSADNAAKEASEEPSGSEAKPIKKSGKKVASSKTKHTTATKKTTSEAKPVKQSGKKAVDSDSVQESSKPKDDKEKQGRGKATDERETSETSSDDDEKPIISSVKSAPKSSKNEKQPVEETPKTNAKRKHSLGKEKASDVKEHVDNLVGSRIKVWWPKDRAFYEGIVDSYDAAKKKHLVLYDDGDQEILNLKREKWELIEEESETTEDEEAEQTGDAKSETPLKKKAKTGGEQLAKQTKTDASAKKSGGASSSKSKAAVATKSGKKTKEDGKIESKSKTPSKPEDGSSEGSEDDEKPKPSGKAAASKPSSSGIGSKSKKEEAATTKSGKTKEEGDSSNTSKAASSKKKEETVKSSSSKSKTEPAKPASSSAAKAKTGKTTGGKSNGSGSGGGNSSKSKSATAAVASSKGKESEGGSEAGDTPKTAEATGSKGKSTASAKAQAKSGKKRKR